MGHHDRPKPPADFDDNPEWTDEDFARARWVATGDLVDPAAYARLKLRELTDALGAAEAAEDEALRKALPKLRAVLDELDQAADTAA